MEEHESSQLKPAHFSLGSKQNKKQTDSTALTFFPLESFFSTFLCSFLDFLYGEVICMKAKNQNGEYRAMNNGSDSMNVEN